MFNDFWDHLPNGCRNLHYYDILKNLPILLPDSRAMKMYLPYDEVKLKAHTKGLKCHVQFQNLKTGYRARGNMIRLTVRKKS